MMKWRGKLQQASSELPQYISPLDRRLMLARADFGNRVAGASTRQNTIFIKIMFRQPSVAFVFATQNTISPTWQSTVFLAPTQLGAMLQCACLFDRLMLHIPMTLSDPA
jgi:hypothetical protein